MSGGGDLHDSDMNAWQRAEPGRADERADQDEADDRRDAQPGEQRNDHPRRAQDHQGIAQRGSGDKFSGAGHAPTLAACAPQKKAP